LRPITSTGSASSVVTAAAISRPTSIVPVVSIVTVQRIGTSRPSSAIASLAPNELVSTTSAPAAKQRSWMPWMTSGRVSTSSSLQTSRPRK
jgi:hypothetical protein